MNDYQDWMNRMATDVGDEDDTEPEFGLGTLAHARSSVSLLGSQKHIDIVNMTLDAMDGLPFSAVVGGWTFKGFTAWAQGLEAEIARLRPDAEFCTKIVDELVRRNGGCSPGWLIDLAPDTRKTDVYDARAHAAAYPGY